MGTISPLLFWPAILLAVVCTMMARWLGGLIGLLALWVLLGYPKPTAYWPPAPARIEAPALVAQPWMGPPQPYQPR